jgi:hypothetical protein
MDAGAFTIIATGLWFLAAIETFAFFETHMRWGR